MKRLSIQSRLLLLVLGSVLVVELMTAWSGYRRALHEVDELLDAQLGQYAQIALALAWEGDDEEVESPPVRVHRYQHKLLFQIWEVNDHERHLMLRSPEAPHGWPAGVKEEGYSEAMLGEHAWRFLAVGDPNTERLVLVAHDLHIRDELARGIALSNMMPYLFGVPVLVVLLILAIRGGLWPLHGLAAALTARAPDRLDDLPEADMPHELVPPVRAMNQLFARIRTAMDNERRFTSDAAHELRTPLAAMHIQLQVAARTPDEDERLAAIAKALRGTGRMTHLVEQLLALARLEGAGTVGGMQPIDLSALLGEAQAEAERSAVAKEVALAEHVQPGLSVQGNPDLLRALLRNLLDNAVRYVDQGGRMEVSLGEQGGRAVLRVADDGPGVAAEERDRLGLRFHRFGPQTAEGVGLGLSIVRRIAELHGAELSFGEGLDGRGLGVTVRFPL